MRINLFIKTVLFTLFTLTAAQLFAHADQTTSEPSGHTEQKHKTMKADGDMPMYISYRGIAVFGDKFFFTSARKEATIQTPIRLVIANYGQSEGERLNLLLISDHEKNCAAFSAHFFALSGSNDYMDLFRTVQIKGADSVMTENMEKIGDMFIDQDSRIIHLSFSKMLQFKSAGGRGECEWTIPVGNNIELGIR